MACSQKYFSIIVCLVHCYYLNLNLIKCILLGQYIIKTNLNIRNCYKIFFHNPYFFFFRFCFKELVFTYSKNNIDLNKISNFSYSKLINKKESKIE